MEIQLAVVVDPSCKGLMPDALSFETGLTRAQAADPTLYAYEHHGKEFTATDPGALTAFYEDLILGRPLPLKFTTPSIKLDTLFAITLFLHRGLATHPAMPGLVAQVDLVHRRGLAMYGHLEPDVTRFFRLMGALFPSGLSKDEEGERLRQAVEWVHGFISNGTLPHLGPEFPQPSILNIGTNGFVLASTTSADTHAAWVELYRQGYLRGLLLGPDVHGRRQVLASRKSVFVDFNLTRAAAILNDMEQVSGEAPEWVADELWLKSPPDGTCLLASHMMEVFLRV